ncbi:tRNA epoxyqueuosine(34) reductase QueG [candidate division WOR-3 bacterium]|nr:tRNA epoxyqueuosine(34) reductase QueG [candidate division WOR-3 bacterium]
MNTENKIKEKAREIGFDLVGITDLEPSVYQKEYRSSIERCVNRDIKYLKETEEERLFPRKKFPWAKSVIVLGINYWQGPLPLLRKGEVSISRYALGVDYHTVLSEKLSILSKFIKEETKAEKIKYYADTGAILEKELAERAGLGWIGKNALLITEDFGSWIFLGEILLDIELEKDKKGVNKCHDCELCLLSCPSKALSAPYSLNIEKCTAFQTIKKKGDLPSWFPSDENFFVFGCDICQEICPFNSKAKITKIKDFIPDKRIINPSIETLQSLSENEFKALFGHTPVNWAGRDVLLRNINNFSAHYAFKT